MKKAFIIRLQFMIYYIFGVITGYFIFVLRTGGSPNTILLLISVCLFGVATYFLENERIKLEKEDRKK